MTRAKKQTEFNKSEQKLILLYLISVFLIMLWRKAWVAYDLWFIFLIIFFMFLGRVKLFWRDWGVFFIVVCAYEFLRGFADDLTTRVDMATLIDWEKKIFSFIPTLRYQQLFFKGELSWYDFLFFFFYFTHFFFPLFFGMIFWLDSKKRFKDFTNAFLLLSLSAFVIFLIFPAAPPWYAAELGFLPKVEKIISRIISSTFLSNQGGFFSLITNLNPNPVAPFPSLHAGWPFLIFLFLLDFYQNKAFLFLPIFLAICFTIVYFGEHYVVDIFAGIAFAFVSFLVTKHYSRLRKARVNSG